MRHKGRQVTSFLSANGRVRLRRVRWHSKDEGSLTPLDEFLDQAAKTFSSGVREMACRLDQCSTSFDKTAQNLGRLASIDISGESVRQLVEHEGKQAARLVRRGRIDPGWDASDCVTDEGRTRVYVGCDGVKVPLVTDQEKRKRRATIKGKRQRSGKRRRALPPPKQGADESFKEFRVVTAYDQEQKRRTVAVTSGDCEQTGRLLRNMAIALKLPDADESIAVVDGAPWIRNQLELHQITDHILLDYFHLKDYAQRTRREVYGEESEEGRLWLEELTRQLLEEGVDEAWDGLAEWRKNLRGRRRKAADRLLGYVAERRDMIRYRESRDHGWQIGSGPTEAQCKSTTLRLKGRGRRWDAANAQAIMALAALEASNTWDSWWASPEAAAA